MATAGEPTPRPWTVRVRAALDALEHLVGGIGTSVLALLVLLGVAVVAVLSLVGVGLLLARPMLHVLHAVADRERIRLTAMKPDVISPGPGPERLGAALRDRTVQRELLWVAVHGMAGFLLGFIALTIVLNTARDGLFPLYWYLLPPDDATASLGWPVHSLAEALPVSLLGVAWAFLSVALLPAMARLQALPGRRLLPAGSDADVTLQIAHLTATRAAALDAHSTELRRIERALHDGTQNRLVAVNVLVGAARRAAARGSADVDEILGRAQDATETALAELRAVVRSILPPVLADRSLADALTALAADCPVPCTIDADLPGRYAVSVEASMYFVVAEALTNVAKHSGANSVEVVLRRENEVLHLRITDDGRGGAAETGGSGLGGMRRRIEALDGTFALASPAGGPTILTVSLPCGL